MRMYHTQDLVSQTAEWHRANSIREVWSSNHICKIDSDILAILLVILQGSKSVKFDSQYSTSTALVSKWSNLSEI